MLQAVSNPPNPWLSTHVEWLDQPPAARLEVYEEESRSILATNDSPDISFTYSVNPYRGCQHACAYCYARPTHQFLGFGAGTDFETRVVVKTNAAELLRRELASRRWRAGRHTIAFSGVTDCYQPLEACYELTRACLAVAHEFRHPVAIITKGALVRRDAGLLAAMAARGGARVFLSIPFADDATARAIEPLASAPSARFETLRRLADAGIPCGAAVAPLIPGLNDSHVPEILERAKAAGATSAFLVPLRLPAEVLPVFRERLDQAFPDRAAKVFAAVRELRGGRLNEPSFGTRMRGLGPRWQAVHDLFHLTCRRLGLDHARAEAPAPAESRQRLLFEDA